MKGTSGWRALAMRNAAAESNVGMLWSQRMMSQRVVLSAAMSSAAVLTISDWTSKPPRRSACSASFASLSLSSTIRMRRGSNMIQLPPRVK